MGLVGMDWVGMDSLVYWCYYLLLVWSSSQMMYVLGAKPPKRMTFIVRMTYVYGMIFHIKLKFLLE